MADLFERTTEVNYRFRARPDYMGEAIAATIARIDAAFDSGHKSKAALRRNG